MICIIATDHGAHFDLEFFGKTSAMLLKPGLLSQSILKLLSVRDRVLAYAAFLVT